MALDVSINPPLANDLKAIGVLDAIDEIIPKIKYRHPHDPSHTPDHILSALIGTSLTLPVENGRLVLGTWQRILLIDFDGPREREILINLLQSI